MASRYELAIQLRKRGDAIDLDADIVFNRGTDLSLDGLQLVRGSHMLRDPRDIAVSSYHYHLWTEEKWVHVPKEGFGGKSYQDFLRSLDPIEGLVAEIRRLNGSVFKRMLEWDYERPEFLELRYEEVIVDESAWFERLFKHYGFSKRAVAESVSIARSFSFENAANRTVGDAKDGTHLRSGRAGQWRDEFTDRHIALFKGRVDGLLIRLGYEKDDQW